MNEKKIFIVCLICLVLFILSSCCTRAAVYSNGNRADAVREHFEELTDQQTEAAIASEQLNRTLESSREQSENLNREITASRADSEQLKQSITDGAADIESLAAILHHIRARGNTANSESAGDN